MAKTPPPPAAVAAGEDARRAVILREGAFLLGALGLAYVALSLFTYSPADPSPISGAASDVIANKGGKVGAHIAALLLEAFGRSSYVFCVVAALLWRRAVWRRRAAGAGEDGGGAALALIGILLCVVSSAAIEFLRFFAGADSLPAGAGGYVGKLFGASMAELFGAHGASLLLLAMWLLSWSLTLGWSLFTSVEKIGHAGERLAAAAWRAVCRLRQAAESEGEKSPPSMPLTAPRMDPIIKPQPRKTRAAKTLPPPAGDDSAAAPPPASAAPDGAAPTLDLLDKAATSDRIADSVLRETAALIEKSLASFNVSAQVVDSHPGPVVTRYDIRPATGVKGAQIVNLARDLARALSVNAIRVLETIPGTNYIGLEIPNPTRCVVNLSAALSSAAYQNSGAALPLALGQTAAGDAAVVDLADMPHLLVAGSTGAGKSVFINAILLSLLFARTPAQLRLLLVDPKMLELAAYADIPHLLAPVVTDMEFTPAALNWAVEEMERRYRLMASAGVRHISAYNAAAEAGKVQDEDGVARPPLHYIVIIIDELADLMMIAGKKVELSVSRLAQKARAAGIHMVLATQRPSVDVITGLIKANIPCRLSFQVASKVDSRTILDQMGAEALLGKGDMLYLPIGGGLPRRLHGAFVSDDEARRVVARIRESNGGAPDYLIDFGDAAVGGGAAAATNNGGGDDSGENDPLYDQAVEAVLDSRRVSISMVQRKLRIGYNRAARMVERMEAAGLVSPMNELGARKVLAPKRD